jgi:hypothetical protein
LDVVPAGWTVARPQQILVNGQCYVSVVLVTGTPPIGKLP